MSDDSEYYGARRTDPETSHMAAAQVRHKPLELKILGCLHEHGGLTTSQITDLTGIDRVSVSPCMAPLARKGAVRDSGKRIKYKTNRFQIVWELNL